MIKVIASDMDGTLLGNDHKPAPETLEEETRAFAARLAARPPRALAMQKAAINEFFYPEIDKFIVRESEYMQACSRTSDFEEAVTAFLEKRSPVFQGK